MHFAGLVVALMAMTLLAPGQAQTTTSLRPNWAPKTGFYNPRGKDWHGVVAGCRAIGKQEKRLMNFFIRAAFHDSLAIDLQKCKQGNTKACGGADSSLVLTMAELIRPENAYDDFAAMAGRAAIVLASYFDVSVSDTMAICGAVGIELLSNDRVKIIGPNLNTNFRVGRLDSLTPSPPDSLPAATATAVDFATFWRDRGFTMEEAMSLMGSHALVDSQGCMRKHRDSCDPVKEKCDDVRMFKWENHYFKDICTPTLRIDTEVPPMEFDDPLVTEMATVEFEAFKNRETCKFTHPAFKHHIKQLLDLERAGKIPIPVEERPEVSITWGNDGCDKGKAWGGTSCPHSLRWWYTVNDAYLGELCQQSKAPADIHQASLRAATRKFTEQKEWDKVVPRAYIKMVTKYARWSNQANTFPVNINGRECASVWRMERQCMIKSGLRISSWWRAYYCQGCEYSTNYFCHKCCQCPTSFEADATHVIRAPETNPDLDPTVDDTEIVDAESGEEFLLEDAPTSVSPDSHPIAPANPNAPNPMDPIPTSPYDLPDGTCSGGSDVKVRGFPATPLQFTPFTKTFKNPPRAEKKFTECSKGPGKHCLDVYEIDAFETTVDLGVGCTAGPTRVMTYNGIVPGPTIDTPKGRQTLVRFNNKLSETSKTFKPHYPCTSSTRKGRPISIHLHGSASLAPYDGWAEDTICSGESKDYLYPNNRATTGWYHDHQLEITAENAHAGMSAMYIIREGPEDRWGLTGMEEHHVILGDRVLDSSCQMRLEPTGVHKNSHFGDINLVNGIPWPVLTAEPKWHRFRVANTALARPWLLSIVDKSGKEVSSNNCFMLASDGGYRRTPIAFPSGAGLFMGVAERYEFACNFAPLAGETLYLWNSEDKNRMKDVPFFCHSHLVMKIEVTNSCEAGDCSEQPYLEMPAESIPTNIDAVISTSDLDKAKARLRNSKSACDRTFIFGRGGGQWVINGETWETQKVAASDVKLNSDEIWCLETKGGWFHPIHIHLIDMYVIGRADSGAYKTLESFESQVPKDVVQLHPGSKVAILARWGPHRGEYMFHCHNLRHEDNEMMRSLSTDNSNDDTSSNFASLNNLVFKDSSTAQMYSKYKSATYPEAYAKPTGSMPALDATLAQTYLDKELYRLFYPGRNERELLCTPGANRWYVNGC